LINRLVVNRVTIKMKVSRLEPFYLKHKLTRPMATFFKIDRRFGAPGGRSLVGKISEDGLKRRQSQEINIY
jgi:hypothetical protein